MKRIIIYLLFFLFTYTPCYAVPAWVASDGNDGAGAVDTTGTVNADEIAVFSDSDTLKALTESEFKSGYNMEAGTDYPDVVTVTPLTTSADPEVVTITAGKEKQVIEVTAHAADVSIQVSETDSEASTVPKGYEVEFKNAGAITWDIATIAGQQILTPTSTIDIPQNGSITFVYSDSAWKEKARSIPTAHYSSFVTTETQYIPISHMIDGASAPDALATVTSGARKVNARTFAGTVGDEDVEFDWQIPSDLVVATGIKFRVKCVVSAGTGPSSETWQFELHGFSAGSGDALNGTLGTEQTSNSGSRTDAQYDIVYTAWSSAMTSTHITDLAQGESAHFKLYRDIDDTDDYGQNVGVIGVEFKFTTDKATTF